MAKIKVIVVDDSKFIRTLFTNLLNDSDEIEVVASAEDPFEAREKIKEFNPDVITLDIEMPKMNGLEFLEKLMRLRPMPVIMVSTLTQAGADATIKALELGAIDCIAKPMDAKDYENIDSLKQELIEKIKVAASAKVRSNFSVPEKKKEVAKSSTGKKKIRLIAIGSSTGGVEALKEVISALPQGLPPIVITQHMPEKFTTSFANRLNSIAQVAVHEAKDKQILEDDNVYIAPGNYHMKVVGNIKGQLSVDITQDELVSGHRPSVDYMFSSIAKLCLEDSHNNCNNNNILAIILTGMGKDGAIGMLELKKLGAHTIGQNANTCVVYGMPKAAFEAGAVDIQKPLEEIANYIVSKL